jgi:hypothetical protein
VNVSINKYRFLKLVSALHKENTVYIEIVNLVIALFPEEVEGGS